MIEIDNIGLEIKNKMLLSNIKLKLEEGTIHGLVGNNGSGKTILMKCICGFMRPTEGQILVDDKRIGVDIDYPESMGIIIESPEFVPYMSGIDNLKHLAALNGKIGKDEIVKTMTECGLQPDLKLAVKRYSLGMRQRLGIAQAIMENPKYLILDEPMNGLDKHGVEEMRKLFKKLKDEGKTIILASHNKDDIDVLCDHVYEMEQGKITKLR